MVEPFVIFCPCCSQPSAFETEFSEVVFLSAPEFQKVAQSEEADKRVFTCRNRTCFSPSEAIVCSTREVARDIQRQCLGDSWTVPRDFRLRKNAKGDLYGNRYGIVFNRRPVKRERNLCLTEYVDERLLSKALLGFAVREDVPVTVFVAHTTRKGVYWAPIEPAIDGQGHAPFYFSPVCQVCREAFGKRIKAEFEAQRPDNRENCDFSESCPRKHCPSTAEALPGQFSQCLRYLDLRKRLCPCYSSDLNVIDKTIERFKRGELKPTTEKCWARLTEVAFPIVVHGHLLGILMTGQFIEGVPVPSVVELLDRERAWRAAHDMDPECLLCAGQELADAVAAESRPPEPGVWRKGRPDGRVTTLDEETRDVLVRRLSDDLGQINNVANDRYGQQREGRESAFRGELAGMLSRRLLERCEPPSFLPGMLERMADFWAFERVCLLVGGEEEGGVRLHATEKQYCAGGPEGGFVKLDWRAGQWPVSILVKPEGSSDPGPDNGRWRKFVSDLNNSGAGPVLKEEKETYIVTIQGGPRIYVFCFSGRDGPQLSELPYYSSDLPIRLSLECKDQIVRTCQSVVDRLNHFWLRVDEEQSHRSLAHTLRSAVRLMCAYQGFFREQLRIHEADVPEAFRAFCEAARKVHRSVRIGSRVVDDELSKLTLASTLEEVIRDAKEGQTDVVDVLRSFKAQFELVGEPDRKRWCPRGAPVSFAAVRAKKELVVLAIRNILDNAYKYSYRDRDICIDLHREGTYWVIRVENHGLAIRPEEIERVTQKGYRGIHARRRKSVAAEGTGLGMYLVKRIMEAVGGEVRVACGYPKYEGSESETGDVSVSLFFPAI